MGVNSSFLYSNMKFRQQQQQEVNRNLAAAEESNSEEEVLWSIVFWCFSKSFDASANNSISARQTNSKSPEDELEIELFIDLVPQFPVVLEHTLDWMDLKITTRRKLHGTILALLETINIQESLCFPLQKQCSLTVDVLHSVN